MVPHQHDCEHSHQKADEDVGEAVGTAAAHHRNEHLKHAIEYVYGDKTWAHNA